MGWLTELLKGISTDQEIQAKLEQAEKRIGALEAERDHLRTETVRLKAELDKMQDAARSALPDFVEASGVLWKRKTSGGFESVPYCPTCKLPLADYSGWLLCLRDNWQAPIKSFEAPKIYHDLFEEQEGKK